jgi:hypothetical protein
MKGRETLIDAEGSGNVPMYLPIGWSNDGERFFIWTMHGVMAADMTVQRGGVYPVASRIKSLI